MAQVFISYSRADLAFVDQLANDIRDAGFDVWYDVSELEGGDRWSTEIEKAIRGSQHVIVVLSPDSVNSEWVEREYLLAGKLKKIVVPLYYRPCELPMGFLNLQYIDVQGANYKHHFNQILNALKSKPASPRKIFICYRRNVKEDRSLAEYLYKYLREKGHDVFIDLNMRVGTAWLTEIDERIKSSDCLIVLVSKDSAESEMVQAEVKRAYEYRGRKGRPKTLPIRMKYEGMLPYAIDAFIGRVQQIEWNGLEDNEQVAQAISKVIVKDESHDTVTVLPHKTPKITSYSEDGRAIYSDVDKSRPLPEFDPRILDELDEPGGSLKLSDYFYIERDSDEKLKKNIMKKGQIITIRASRQTGKSSLLVRGIHHARKPANMNIVYLDLQAIPQEKLSSADRFLNYFVRTIVRKLDMDESVLNQIWHDEIGPQDKLMRVMEDYILPENDRQIILAMDEADRLLNAKFYSDFFALMRSWHNNRAIDPQWSKLNIIMVIATEPYLLISDSKQSPFNVGVRLNLEDFNRQQVDELNRRHGNPIQENDRESFFELFNGHPYLTRKALYLVVSEHWAWSDLYRKAADDQGPFADHLRRQLWFVKGSDSLQSGLRQVMSNNKCDDDEILWRLLRAGLIKGKGNSYYCRCGLYERYFKGHLK